MAEYRDGGFDVLRQWDVTGSVNDLADNIEIIKNSLTAFPVRTVAEAAERIETLTGLRRGPTQVRQFLAWLGFRWQRTRAIPVPLPENCQTMSGSSGSFSTTN
ncbi:hypothetical protein [Zavarzinella formosa]|uniref:hypothetical protein n=1 Tax=Zavarzinella formosa TaxID=360055 RepID=UPI0003015987|nr:hypothetical protein [Zavarzinella formosa]